MNTDRLYEHEQTLFTACGFDLQKAGAILLGKDTVKVCKTGAISVITALKQDQQFLRYLQDQITRTTAGSFLSEANKSKALVDAFFVGFSTSP